MTILGATPSGRLLSAQALLYQALQQPIGIAVQTNDVMRARAMLYKARAEANDLALARLQLRINPLAAQSEIFIVRGPEAQKVGL